MSASDEPREGYQGKNLHIEAMVRAMEHFYAHNPCGCPPNDIGGQWIHRDGCRFSYVEAPETCEVFAAVLAEVARQDAGCGDPDLASRYGAQVWLAATHIRGAIREAMRLSAEGA